jgi:SAM-dependent methyltransferase
VNQLAHSHNWLIYALIDPALERSVRAYAKGLMLDIGCGVKPYEGMAAPYVKRHIGLDRAGPRCGKTGADVIASAYSIPARDGMFDTILCTDLLEHLEEPAKALREARRVLRRGGHAIVTVPLYWHLHEEPRDFYRYTMHGLRYLFETTGFEIIDIHPLTGFVANYAQSLVYFLYSKRRGPWWNPARWVIALAGAAIQVVGYLLANVDHSYAFTMEYLLVAKRPCR